MERVEITVFADPVCTWCWGSVPVLRAVEHAFGDKVEIEYVMSGMSKDIRSFVNRRLEIGGDIALSNRNMMKAWLEASVVHGMPVLEHGLHLFSEKYTSTFPQNMAYIAAKMCCTSNEGYNTSRANRYLRRIQEATAVEAMQTAKSEVLADLAAVEGFAPEEFLQILGSDAVKTAFAADRERAKIYDVKDFPTFLIEYEGRETVIRGYTTFASLLQEIEKITDGKLSAKTLKHAEHCTPTVKNVKNFVDKHHSVYPVEIATAFFMKRKSGRSAVNIESYEELPDIVDELLKGGEVGMTPVANSFKIFALKKEKNHSLERERELHGIY